MIFNGYAQFAGAGQRVQYGDLLDDIFGVAKDVVGMANKVFNPTTAPAPTPQAQPVQPPPPQQQMTLPIIGRVSTTQIMLGVGGLAALWMLTQRRGRR